MGIHEKALKNVRQDGGIEMRGFPEMKQKRKKKQRGREDRRGMMKTPGGATRSASRWRMVHARERDGDDNVDE